MIIVKFPVYLIIIIFSYLSNRKMIVTVSRVFSEPYSIPAGVPQGSVLGPILFIFYMFDSPKNKLVEESTFADDKALLAYSYRISTIVKRLTEAFNKLYKYYNKWKIKINTAKTEAIIFTKRYPEIKQEIIINDHPIAWLDSVTYLGLILDTKLTFTKHINFASDKAQNALIKFYPLLNRQSKLSPKNKLIIYKAIIRPAMLYACPVWSLTSQTNFSKLQVQQNKFLRLAGNYRKFTRISLLHNEQDIDHVYDYVKEQTKKYFKKSATHPSEHIRKLKCTSTRTVHKMIKHILT